MVSCWGPWHPSLWEEPLAGSTELWPARCRCMCVSSVKEQREKQVEGSPSLVVEKSSGSVIQGCLWDRLHNSERSHCCAQEIPWYRNISGNSNIELCDLFVLADAEEHKQKANDETSFFKTINFFQKDNNYFVQSLKNNAGFSRVFSIVHGSFPLSEGALPFRISILVFLIHFSFLFETMAQVPSVKEKKKSSG